MREGVGGGAFPGDFGVSDNVSISILVTKYRLCQTADTKAADKPPGHTSRALSPPASPPLSKLTGELQLGPHSLGTCWNKPET